MRIVPSRTVGARLRVVVPALLAHLALVALPALPGPARVELHGQETPEDGEPGRLGEAWSHLRELPREFLSDAWATTTAPFKLRGDDAWTLAAVVGAAGVLFAADEWIQDGAVRASDDPPLDAVLDAGEFVEPMALQRITDPIWGGGLVLGALAGRDRLRNVFQELLFSHVIAGLTRAAVGLPVGRMRPKRGFGPYEFRSLEGRSFFSGHSATATSAAAVLAHHIDRWPATVLLYGAAGSVVYQRVASGNHWASDAFLGAAVGWGVARVVVDRREADRQDFVPVFDPVTGTLGFRLPAPF